MLGLWLNITKHKKILLPYLLFSFYVHNVSSLLIIVLFRLPCPPLAKRGSLPYTQALNPYHRIRDVTALRCSEPLRYKVGGASKPCAMLCGMGPPSYYLAKGAGYYPYFRTTLSCNKSQRERNVFNV